MIRNASNNFRAEYKNKKKEIFIVNVHCLKKKLTESITDPENELFRQLENHLCGK